MRFVDVPTSRSPSLREMRGTTILALAAGVALTLPKRPAQDDDIHVIVKAMGAGCTVRAQTSGLALRVIAGGRIGCSTDCTSVDTSTAPASW